jgi:ribosomal protein S12 methylthiotransferase
MKKIGMVSLGCPKNAVDTEFLLGDLLNEGYELTPNEKEADVVIVNTCGFIESAKRESVDAILEMAQLKTNGNCSQLIVTGCLSERYSEELLKEIPEIDHMLGVGQYPLLKEILRQSGERNLVHAPVEYFNGGANRILTTPFYSAYLKIAEGCSNKCSFCIIPKMRGPFRSRTIDDLMIEARKLAESGVKELNLVSQDTTMYGIDLRMKNGLVPLLEKLSTVEGIEWIRLFYCYPTFINNYLLDAIAGLDKVCPYIDVPLQHTHDFMLQRMKRQEREAGVRIMLEEIRKRIPGVALRTTFITGFPGEQEEHFNHMQDFVREMQFDHVGLFTYSHEEGTTAFELPHDVPHELALERNDELMSIQREICLKKNADQVGKTIPILVEGVDKEEEFLVTGRTPTQAPDIDGQVLIESSDVQVGEIVPMRITGSTDYDLIASAIESSPMLVE